MIRVRFCFDSSASLTRVAAAAPSPAGVAVDGASMLPPFLDGFCEDSIFPRPCALFSTNSEALAGC